MHYPKGIKKNYKSNTHYDNRGMNLENDLNSTNEYYKVNDIAVIYKKPTPITIVKVDYPSRYEAVIKEAYFKTPSTTDYNGIYKGKYIDFEAKETRLTSFPLNNIHKHQIEHLNQIIKHGGIGFLIVSFVKYNKTFVLTAQKLIEYINNNSKKTIPISFFENEGHLVNLGYIPRLDYLKVIDKLILKESEYEENNKKN